MTSTSWISLRFFALTSTICFFDVFASLFGEPSLFVLFWWPLLYVRTGLNESPLKLLWFLFIYLLLFCYILFNFPRTHRALGGCHELPNITRVIPPVYTAAFPHPVYYHTILLFPSHLKTPPDPVEPIWLKITYTCILFNIMAYMFVRSLPARRTQHASSMPGMTSCNSRHSNIILGYLSSSDLLLL